MHAAMGITDEMIRDGTATHRNGSGPTLVAVLAPIEDGGVGLETLLEEKEVAICGGVASGVEAISTAGDGGESRRHAGVGGEHRGGGERSGREWDGRSGDDELGADVGVGGGGQRVVIRCVVAVVDVMERRRNGDHARSLRPTCPNPQRAQNGAKGSRTRGTKM